MAPIDLRFRLDQTNSVVTAKEANLGLAYIGHTGSTMTIVSGLAIADALNYAGFGNDHFVLDAIKAAGDGLAPQTLGTAVYQNHYLVAGTKLEIQATFVPGDKVYNDEAFTLLKDNGTGEIVPVRIANVNDVIKNNSQDYTVTYTINQTGFYNLMVGVADIGDKTHPSSLTVNSLTTIIPGGQYTVKPQGVLLADNSVLRSDSSILVGSTVIPNALADSAGSTVAALQNLLAQNLIGQDGGGLIGQDGGGLISQDGGGLISQDGGGAVAIDASSLLPQDGGGLLDVGLFSNAQLASIAANLASTNNASFRAYNAASTAGLTGSHNYGLMSLDGSTDPVPDISGGGSTAYVAPVPGLEVDLSGAAALRYDGQSAVADLGAGRYVVAFSEYVVQPNGARAYTIRAQVVNADGSLSGSELTVNDPNDSDQGDRSELDTPSVAATGDGGFVVAWVNGQHPRPPGLTTGSDLFAQRFNADGSRAGAGVALDAEVTDTQYNTVKLASLTNGGYVAVWSEKPGNGSNVPFTLHGTVFNADGSQRGASLSLSGSKYFADLFNPAVAATASGFVVAFQGNAPNPVTGGTLTGIGIQAYDANGTATGQTTLVQASANDVLTKPNVAVLANGDIAVAWVDTTTHDIYSLVMTAALVAKGEATIVGGSYVDYYGPPAITATSDGRFLVGWTQGTAGKAQAQAVSDDNTLYGPQFDVAAPGGGDSTDTPAFVQLSTGTLVASSTHHFYSLGGSGVRALPIDLGTGSTNASTQTGQPLNTGSAVDGYIASATVFADANGNGRLDAGEVSAKTTADGAFALAPGAKGPLVLTGGTDVTTGQAFTGRFTAPEGSHAINALTTLVQGVVSRGSDIGTAGFKVATAFGMTADAELTNLDAMTAATHGSQTGRAVLLANALVSDIAALATAAGSGDALGAFASLIASKAGFTAFDPSSTASLAAAGLSGQVLSDAGAIASAVKALLASQATADGTDAAKLVRDVGRLEVVVHAGAAAFASAIGTGTTAHVAAAYTGDALQAKFGAATVQTSSSPTTTTTPATVGVYRFFDSKYGTHFFTASANERSDVIANRSDLVNEGVGLTAIDPAANDPNAAAVYRFFDTRFGTHFFTASGDERDQVIANRKDLTFEGTGFYEHTTQQSGDTPVYRFFDKNYGTHFYTADSGERATILATRSDLIDEGIGFYAPKPAT